ncbi:ABC transporter permease [Corallococcus sp. H22C18031201]|uniref:ABC transporter permease n=1 Tax=Citreicoccus inhibens TaxID=2849499 RepID=UPI000E72851E|nr:ABC transporter permease [Citreicoccus inhibens]MBU8895916.1 ABC transporter permease [Citreicoccus inhibens]RJS23914.1 ABC transporter permease [Corallococcus sp. H22C18031201]
MSDLSNLRHRLTRRLRALFDRGALERELDDELRFHLEMEVEHLMRQGLSPEAARAKAQREFGGEARAKEAARDARGLRVLEDAARDVRLALRSLRRSPAYTAVALLTLALGIGATVAVFSGVDAALLRSLPFPDAGQLVMLHETNRKYPEMHFAGANFREVEEHGTGLSSVAYYGEDTVTVLGGLEPRRSPSALVSPRFFDVMGVRPLLGRGFTSDEGAKGQPPAAVVSHRFWQQVLGGDPSWVGRTLRLGSGDTRVVGVMPQGFQFPAGVDVWLAYVDTNPHRTAHNWSVVGRLRHGVTPERLGVELAARFASLKAELGTAMDAEGVIVTPLQTFLSRDSRTPLLVLLGSVGLVLLVACVNLTSAGLARAQARQRELAIRSALGAGRGRLLRQLLVESLVLSFAGGALGVGIAVGLLHLLGTGASPLSTLAAPTLDARVLGFALAVSLLTGLAVGSAPALHVTRDLRGAMAQGATGTGGGRLRGRALLISAEVALALMLLVGAGLLLKSLHALLGEDPGFHPERVLMAEISLPESRYGKEGSHYGDGDRVRGFYERLTRELRELPGVESVGVINQVPLSGMSMTSGFMVDDGTVTVGSAGYHIVDTNAFATLGVPLLRGRALSEEEDRAGSPHVTLINRAMAERYWPGSDPLGHRIRLPGMDAHKSEWMTVVGVVGDVRQDGLDAAPKPQLFVPQSQRPERLMAGATVLVRASGPLSELGPRVRAVVRATDPDAPVEVSFMADLVTGSVASRRLLAVLIAGFASLALFLAAVGIYGVLAYSVAQRQRELGIRMALGARPGAVRAMVLRDAMRAVLPGVGVGLVGALVLTRLLRGLLYGVSETDPTTFVGVALALTAVALAASWIPSRRATQVDPLLAIKGD